MTPAPDQFSDTTVSPAGPETDTIIESEADTAQPASGETLHADSDAEAERRLALLDAVLAEVPFEGWSDGVVRKAAERLGWPAVEAEILFPAGAVGVIEFWSTRADETMLKAFESLDGAEMKVRERILTAIRLRLEEAQPHRDALGRALALLALPTHALLATRLLHRTVDTVWYAAGDRSTDFNWYTKRGLLAPVYAATVLYWLQDGSDDQAASWEFLARRLDGTVRLGKWLRPLGGVAERLTGLLGRFSARAPGKAQAEPQPEAQV